MRKLTINNKNKFTAGAAKPAANIGSYLKIFSASSLVNLGVGVTTNLLNIVTSLSKVKNNIPQSFNINGPKLKNISTQTMNFRI